jgi:predicted  nucleic acid-binding Zn-ribbon protein
MPEFDRNLNPILLNTDQALPQLDNPANRLNVGPADYSLGGRPLSATERFFGEGPIVTPMAPTVSAKELYENRRYATYSPDIIDIEDQKAYAQSNWDKAANGLLKGVNLVGTTVAGGFGMLYGLAKSPFTGRLADIWDNNIMRDLDAWNNKVDQEFLPNYYTNVERDAKWYSPDNWWRTNFLFDKLIKNSGFAVGAMVSGNIANAGLRIAGAAIGEAAATVTASTAAETSQAFKLFTPLLRNTARAFSAGKNIETAAVLEREISSIADLTAKASRIGEIAKDANFFANINDVGRRTAIAAYSSAGEASFEALQTATEHRNNLIQKFRNENGGQDPTGAELDAINESAEAVGKASFFGNLALLSATEYVQLPYLAGSTYKSSKQAANSLLGKADDVILKEGKWIAKETTSNFAKIWEKARVGRYVFDPKEAGQELGQYALQVGTQNYFSKAYQGQDANAWVDGFLYGFVGRDERGEGRGALVSKEGMESLVLGGITGGLMQSVGQFKESKAISNNTQSLITGLNNAPTFKEAFKEKLDAVNRGVVLQQQQQDAVINGDELEAKDLKADLLHNYLAPRIKYGRFDLIMDDLQELKREGLTQGGLAALKEQGLANINDTVDSYQERLGQIEASAKNTEELYKSMNLRFGGEMNADGTKKYPPKLIDKMIYAASKIADYDVRIPQVNAPLAQAGVVTSEILNDVIIGGKPKQEALDKATEDILKLQSVDYDDLVKKLNDVIELSYRRKLFLNEFNEMKTNPEKYLDKEVSETPTGEQGETVSVKTKDGDEELEVGQEYFLGKVVEFDKNGKEVYRFPKLTILGENEDGTIKIKDSNGNVKDVSKDVLLDYKLGKVSAVASNENASFYMRNMNNPVYWNTGKGKGGKIPGRLVYDGGKLYFVYKDKKGKIRETEVGLDSFEAKTGFAEGIFTFGNPLTAQDSADIAKRKASGKTKEDIDSRRGSRLKILSNLFDEVSTQLDSTKDLITKKREELAKVNDELSKVEEQIKSGDLTKKNTFKSATNKAIKAANKLSRLREDLRLEIESLEAERDTLEFNLAYVADMAQNIDELPTDSKEFLSDLKEQVSNLESMILENGNNINQTAKLMEKVDKALKDAVDFAFDLINKFEAKYPSLPVAPIALRQFLNKDMEVKGVWPDYQSYLQANPNLLNDLLEFDRELADIDELDVIPNERTLKELGDSIREVQNGIAELEKELRAKETILAKFQEVADKYKQEVEEENKMRKSEEFRKAALGTLSSDQPTLEASDKYEADRKKNDKAVVASTVNAGNERSNKFGANLENLPNRKNIRGVYLTAKNEIELGLEGFTDDVVKNQDPSFPPVEKSKIIALVMVEQNPDNPEDFWLVDENGQRLENANYENVVYQMFPLEDLEWDDKWSKTPGKKVSMFRKSTPKEVVDDLKKQYTAWRNGVLENPTLARYNVQASFGKPEYVSVKDQNGNEERVKDAAVAVSDSGLVREGDLRTEQVVLIPTVQKSIDKGSTLYNDPKGLPFLDTPNGYVKLQNRKLTQQEVKSVYQAIKRLVKNMYEDGNAKSADSKRLLNWLKSVVYWGTPQDAQGNRKPAAFNSIWFEQVDADGIFKEIKLFISGLGENVPFTPTAIADNEGKIIALLEGMYNNVNATMVSGGQKGNWNESYEELLEIPETGDIKSRTWKNYQSFLLSKNDPDGKARDAKQIPLTTQIRPLESANDVNRQGIYFTVLEAAQSYTIPEVKATKKATTVITPGAPKQAVKEGEQKEAPAKPDLTGKVRNTFTSPSGLKINYTANAELLLQNDPKGLLVLQEADVQSALEALQNAGKTLEEAKKQIRGNIIASLTPYLNEYKNQKAQAGMELVLTDDAVEEVEDSSGEEMTDAQMRLFKKQAASTPNRTALRVKLVDAAKKFEGENWNKVETWLKANFPNIPVYRVKNILKATNGIQAWGMFQDGAIYVYENAEVGTIYHEVFEAVWKMFADNTERQAVIGEFKNRQGSFVDRPTGQTVKYFEATDQQIKEQLAEEFRDYVQEGKIPAKPKDGRPFIVKLFADLVNFIKQFFTGKTAKNNTEKLFEKIGTGYYKQHAPYHNALSYAKEGLIDIEDAIISDNAEFRIKNIRGEYIGDIIQHMTYATIKKLVSTNESLFSVPELNKKDLYNDLLEEVQSSIAQTAGILENAVAKKEISPKQAEQGVKNALSLWKNVTDQWDDIVAKHEEKLKSFNIEFDENDNATLRDEDASKRGDWQNATQVDNFRKANGAIKLLLSTIPITRRLENGKLETVESSINGVKLLSPTEVYMAIMNNVHKSRNVDEMMEKIREMAINDPNYEALYTRLTNNYDITKKANLTKSLSSMHDVQLITAFWKSFKKQSPDVKTVYILDNGDIVVGDSNFTTAARQLKEEYVNSIKKTIKGKNPYFEYSEKEKGYIGKPGSVANIQANTQGRVRFLANLGIEFDANEIDYSLSVKDREKFNTAVDGIVDSIGQAKKIATVNAKVLNIDGRLRQLSELQAKLDNPEFSSTYFNVNGERTQTFIGTNAASDLFDALSQIDNLSELQGTQYEYLTKGGDVFATHSNILSRMFDLETGKRIQGSEDLMKTAYADGLIDMSSGKKKQSSKLTYAERLTQEVNMNLEGYYMNLIPGDASIEWMMYMGNAVSEKEMLAGFTKINEIFKGYFLDEYNLSKDNRKIATVKGRKTTDLRFFKAILGDKLHNDIIKESGTAEEVYTKYEDKINKAVANFVKEQTATFRETLEKYQIVERATDDNNNFLDGYDINGLALSSTSNVSNENLNLDLTRLTVNYMINNIELHKLLYSDPYQYSDELKRIKSFNSPRQALIYGSAAMNSAMHRLWNTGFAENSVGYTNFDKDFFKTTTLEDIKAINDLPGYDAWDETDGGGIITLKAHREFRIRSGEWTTAEESQYKHDVAYEELVKSGASEKEIAALEKKNPNIKSVYTPLKPIVSGNKADGNNYNDVVLDKFALYPLSFRILHKLNASSNALRTYNKMQKEGIDYAVFATGRKVGATVANPVYNEDGSLNNNLYEGIINVPFAIMSVQSEVPSKEDNLVTRGSQVTKEMTMDYMEAGVPIDFEEGGDFTTRFENWYKLTEEQKLEKSELYKEIKNNQDLLEELTEVGYQNVLKSLGIVETKDGFEIGDSSKAVKTLREEIFKREVNDNISDALEGFLDGDVVLEATPAYQQVRNILYSIVDREITSPKVNGGQKVQISSALLESVKAERAGKQGFTSDTLKFYEDKDGKRYCEIMVGRWFKSDKTDAELLEYFNNTPEGQKVLSGLAFRIPTQKQNSIDAFRIKQFLPEEFGDSVVIPSALVKKVGSDFDIDKLFIYLKNVYTDAKGDIKIIPYYGIGAEAREKLKRDILAEDLKSVFRLEEDVVRAGENDYENLYRKSLENAYIESGEKLVSHPKNFERLIKPNSADQLKKLAGEITDKLKTKKFDYANVGNMLDRSYMSNLRHAFVSGKYAIGIAAVSQTNHSLNQRQPIYIDPARLGLVGRDAKWLGDAKVKFTDFNRIIINGESYATLSMIKNAEGQDISDIIGQFIDGYVDISKGPWIMELGATPNVASTWLFLVKVGVPIDTVAYFMNQPIIRDYLTRLESAGKTWIFDNELVEDTLLDYKTSDSNVVAITKVPSNTALSRMVGSTKLDGPQKAQQQFILGEFLKYAAMASQLFKVTNGTNYDTASFNDPYLIFKKNLQYIESQQNIISSSADLINNSFIGKVQDKLNNVRDALSLILKSDSGNVRRVMQQLLSNYVNLSDRDFVKMAQKAVADLFDYAVQVDQELNAMIQDTLLSDTKNAAKEIATLVNQAKKNAAHPLHNNQVIKLFDPKFSDKKNGVNNINLKNKDNKVYDQNQIIYAFNEIKSYLKEQNNLPLYEKLVRASVLQSGLSTSPISFTNLLPYSDFKEIYNKTLARLEKPNNFTLDSFLELNVFQRNNWSNDDIVPHKKAKWRVDEKGRWKYNGSMNFAGNRAVSKAMADGKISPIVRVSPFSREGRFDVIVYSWETGTKAEKAAKRKIGDYSFINKGLFKKVTDDFGEPLTESFVAKDGTVVRSFIYKAINAWGDSFRANEFYNAPNQSIIDNGFIPVTETEDTSIVDLFENKKDEVDNKRNQKSEIKPSGKPAINNKNKNNCG